MVYPLNPGNPTDYDQINPWAIIRGVGIWSIFKKMYPFYLPAAAPWRAEAR